MVHAVAPRCAYPGWQGCIAEGTASGNVGGDGLGGFTPAGSLPQLERSLRPAKAPAQGEIEVAGIVGYFAQLHGTVVEEITEDAPQKLRLRVAGSAQRLHAGDRVAHAQQGDDFNGKFITTIAVIAHRRVENLDGLALFAENPALALLPQCAFFDQPLHPGGHAECAMPGVIGQRVVHGGDHMGQRIQPDHVAGAVGGALGAANPGAGQGVDGIRREVAGFVLLVPHYLADTEYPAAALAGLDSVSVATGLVFDADEIRDENKEYLAKVDDQVEGNAELTAMLHTLEERYDSYMAGSTLAQPIIHTGDLPSADELAAELERFLADRRDGDDRRGRR